jgi:hypothetical protein
MMNMGPIPDVRNISVAPETINTGQIPVIRNLGPTTELRDAEPTPYMINTSEESNNIENTMRLNLSKMINRDVYVEEDSSINDIYKANEEASMRVLHSSEYEEYNKVQFVDMNSANENIYSEGNNTNMNPYIGQERNINMTQQEMQMRDNSTQYGEPRKESRLHVESRGACGSRVVTNKNNINKRK